MKMGELQWKRGIVLSSFVVLVGFFCTISVDAVPDGWSNAINLTNATDPVNPSRMAVDSDNNLHIVWSEYAAPGLIQPQYMKINENGTILISRTNLTASTYPFYGVDVDVDSDDSVHIVWSSPSGISSSMYIYYTKRDKNGNVLITPKGISPLAYTGVGGNSPTIKTDSKNNAHVFYAFQDTYGGQNSGRYNKVDNNGNPIVNTTTPFYCFSYQEIDVGTNDTLHAVASHCSGNYFRVEYVKFDENGTILVDKPEVSNDYALDPGIEIDSENNNHITWISYYGSQPNKIVYTKLDFNGTTLIDDINLTSLSTASAYRDSTLTIDGLNRLHVSYTNISHIYYVELDNNGNILQEQTDITPEFPSGAGESFILADNQDKVQLVWMNFSTLFYKKKVGAPLITKLIPIQVVEDVPLVKGKRTLVRAVVESSTSGGDTLHVKVYFNNTEIANNNSVIIPNPQTAVNIDTWVPDAYIDITGTNVPVRAEAVSTMTGFSSPNKTKTVDVVETRDLSLFFVPVNNVNFNSSLIKNTEFMEKTYPLKNQGIKKFIGINVNGQIPASKHDKALWDLRGKIMGEAFIAKTFTNNKYINAIGIVPNNYLDNLGATGINFINPARKFSDVILVEESQLNTLAHEVGHTFELCDESDKQDWSAQNSNKTCPNGDQDNNETLDDACFLNDGCPTTTLGPLFDVYGNINESITLKNFMGGPDGSPPYPNFESWISRESYNALFTRLNVSSNFDNSLSFVAFLGKYIFLQGSLFQNNSFIISPYYQLENGFINNQSAYSGGYSFKILDNNSQVISNINFEPQFFYMSENGTIAKTNVTSIFFALPINETAVKIQLTNGTVLSEVDKTLNSPIININFPLQDISIFGTKNITWQASDLDNNTLNYAVILNKKDGINTTLGFDIDQTNLTFNFSTQENGEYTLTVLATDGFNTNASTSTAFCIDPDLSVCNLKLLEKNQTKATFGFFIANALNQSLSNINWTVHTEGNNITSNTNFNLTSQEDIMVIFEYLYGSTGNYTFTAISSTSSYTDSQSINVTI